MTDVSAIDVARRFLSEMGLNESGVFPVRRIVCDPGRSWLIEFDLEAVNPDLSEAEKIIVVDDATGEAREFLSL